MKTAFAQRDCLMEIGNPDIEKNLLINGKMNSNFQILYTGEPRDSVRNSMSLYASLFAYRFILCHELGHIFNGHTQYLDSIYMNSKIEMRLESFINNTKYCLDRRTLEMDADAYAATSSFDNVAIFYRDYKNAPPCSLFDEAETIFKIWSFAICSIFLFFETMGKTIYDSKSFYLPNEARFLMVMYSAYETAQSYVKYNIVPELRNKREEIINYIFEGIKEAENFFAKIYKHNFNWASDLLKPNYAYSLFADEVLNNWDNSLRKRLEKYAVVPLYDKDKMDEIMKSLKYYR